MHIKHTYGRRFREANANSASVVLSSRISGLKSSIELGEQELRRRLTGSEITKIEKQPGLKIIRKPLQDLTNKQPKENANKIDLEKPSTETELPSILSSPLIIDHGKAVFRRKRTKKWKSQPAQKPRQDDAQSLLLLSDPDYLDGKIWVKE